MGTKVTAITNLSYSKSLTSRHPSKKKLYELADIILDNHGDVGDACIKIDGLEQKVSPTSTVIGTMMLNSIVAAVVHKLVDSGMKKPPIFYSANYDGGDALNQKEYIKIDRDKSTFKSHRDFDSEIEMTFKHF